jgi:hypothetical protein
MFIAQPVIQYDLNNDIRVVSEMAAGLVPYVYEQELYGPMPPNMPRLTFGGLLMRLHRLHALRDRLSPEQQAKVDAAQAALDKARKDWPVAFEGKLEREIDARLKTLGGLLQECRDDQRHCGEAYPSEIEKRVMLEHLADAAQAQNTLTDVQKAGIKGFDTSMRGYAQESAFIWDERLQPAYPRSPFWFLYMRPKAASRNS